LTGAWRRQEGFAFPRLIDQYPAMISKRQLNFLKLAGLLLLAPAGGGCAVVAVADAAVTVVATTVKVGATVVETTVDVAAAGVKAVAGSSDDEK
jgi:hypothetical protein